MEGAYYFGLEHGAIGRLLAFGIEIADPFLFVRFKDGLVKESCSDGSKNRCYPKQPKLHNRIASNEKSRAS